MKHRVMFRCLHFLPLLSLTALVVLPQAQTVQQRVSQDEEDTPRLKDVVLVRVEVRDKRGNFVPGLRERDFTVYENGVRQPVFVIEPEPSVAEPNQYLVGYFFKGPFDGKYRQVRVEAHKKRTPRLKVKTYSHGFFAREEGRP